MAMSDRTLVETQVSSEELFRGKLLHAFRDKVSLPNGQAAVREYVVHPGAVMVIPLLTRDSGEIEVVLERQFRYPVGEVMIEFPAGKIDQGEAAFICGQRELLEETGYSAEEWARAGVLHPVIAYSTEVIEIWFARGLSFGAQALDDGEFLEIFTASPDQLLQWCRDGLVTDAKTLAGAMWLQNYLSGDWPLNWIPAQSVAPAP
jgi:ADP-ribose pyrophosphatase